MAGAESLIKAFAAGLVEALLHSDAAPAEKQARPKVAKVNDVEAAVRKYLDEKLSESEPEQQDLFPPQTVDLGEQIARRVEEARSRADAAQTVDEMPPGYFDANAPGQKAWTSASKT